MELSCNPKQVVDIHADTDHENTFDSSIAVIENLLASGVHCYASFPLSRTIRECTFNAIRTCPKYCVNTNLKILCTTNETNRVRDTSAERGSIYNNVYCALCNGVNVSSIDCYSNKILSTDHPASFSLSVHFDLNQNYDVHMEIKTLRCKRNQLFPGGIDCRMEHNGFGPSSSNHSCNEISNFSFVQSLGDFKDIDECNTVGTWYISDRLSPFFPWKALERIIRFPIQSIFRGFGSVRFLQSITLLFVLPWVAETYWRNTRQA